MIETRCHDTDTSSFLGYISLAWAAYIGFRKVIEKLLGRGDFNPDKPDNCRRIPLLYAANHGHKEALKTRGRREDVDPDKPGGCGKIPLSDAAIPEHE